MSTKMASADSHRLMKWKPMTSMIAWRRLLRDADGHAVGRASKMKPQLFQCATCEKARALEPYTPVQGPSLLPNVSLEEQWSKHQCHRRQEFDQHMQRRAGRVFERIAH